MAVQTSWPLIQGLAKLKQPPWFLLELVLVLMVIVGLVGSQLSAYRGYWEQSKHAQVMSHFLQARQVVEAHWNLYGRFPDDFFVSARGPELKRWLLLDLLGDGRGEGNDSNGDPMKYKLTYGPAGRLSFTPMETNRHINPERVDFVPTIVGEFGGKRIQWRCVSGSTDSDPGLSIAPYPPWCPPDTETKEER